MPASRTRNRGFPPLPALDVLVPVVLVAQARKLVAVWLELDAGELVARHLVDEERSHHVAAPQL